MNITHLRTLLAVKKTGSLSGAARLVHLSHSAVSVQMKQLETNVGTTLFIDGKRPATLTPVGEEVAREAAEIVARIDNLRDYSQIDGVTGQMQLGFVPTTLETLLPVVLRRLRTDFPNLQVQVRSGLSSHLAREVETGDLDFAFISAPVSTETPLRLHQIGTEPLVLITSLHNRSKPEMAQVMQENPNIAFNRETRLGGHISEFLGFHGFEKNPEIELDSIDAIENLVAQDFGVSIVPQRIMAPVLDAKLRCIPLGEPFPVRQLMLASSPHCRRRTIRQALAGIAT